MAGVDRWSLAFVVVALSLLQACASGGVSRGVAAVSDPDKGTVIARVSIQGIKYVNHHAFLVRRVGANEDAFWLPGWSMQSDGYWSRYHDDIEKGELTVLSVPAGEYEIHGWNIGASGWGGLRTSKGENKFSYRFRVEPGKAVYLGNIHMAATGDSGIAFQSATFTQKTIVRDLHVRDLAELPKVAPGLAPDRVEVRLAK